MGFYGSNGALQDGEEIQVLLVKQALSALQEQVEIEDNLGKLAFLDFVDVSRNQLGEIIT
jgi:hypothetical protein